MNADSFAQPVAALENHLVYKKTERITPQSVSTDLIISFYCRQINKMMKKREFISTGAPFLAKPAPVCYNNR